MNSLALKNSYAMFSNVAVPSQHLYLAVMAGGDGTRLQIGELPKQFCGITSPSPMISETVSRFIEPVRGTTPFWAENIFVATQTKYADVTRSLLSGDIPDRNIIAQPLNRNTFPAMLIAMQRIAAKDPLAVVVCCAADHWIEDVPAFRRDVDVALSGAVRTGGFFTFGIEPTWPDTGYGYIKAPELETNKAFANALEFVEKPSLKVASDYLDSGDYYWNSGIFVWSAMSFIGAAYRYSDDAAIASARVMTNTRIDEPVDQDSLLKFLEMAPTVSVDVAIMQRAAREHRVFVRKMHSRWSDVGTWPSVLRLYREGAIFPSEEVEFALRRMSDQSFD